MDRQLVIICLLTAGINLIGTLAYAARIAGVRTGRIAMSFALFNMLVLVSRTLDRRRSGGPPGSGLIIVMAYKKGVFGEPIRTPRNFRLPSIRNWLRRKRAGSRFEAYPHA